MHMPGHKRNPLFSGGMFPLDIDLTEVFGTDNLHCPASIIKDAQERAAELWGARESFILVNGSTCGILSSVFALTKPGDTVLADRGSHISVFNAIELRGLKPLYLLPEYDRTTGIRAGITVREIETKLNECPDAAACIITSPTYEGAVCDVQSIARLCHGRNIPLIVDSAHGAHLGFSDAFPQSAVKCGADAVIISLHKTLPALTQTAMLHINGDCADFSRIKKYLAMFETSSPSYILMASADYCTDILLKDTGKLFSEYKQRLDAFYAKTAPLGTLSLPYADGSPFFGFDRGKIVVSCANAGITGFELQGILRNEYRIETEMAAPAYLLAITSVCDTDEGFKRLSDALTAADKTFTYCNKRIYAPALPVPECIYTPSAASLLPKRFTSVTENEGKISGSSVCVYPPGVPVLLPGERITPQVIDFLTRMKEAGASVIGGESIIDK